MPVSSEPVHYANPHRPDWPACTTSVYGVPSTSHGQDVTCSACRAWIAHTPPRLYLAGPMTGYPDWNFPAFNVAAEQLRDAGYIVFNPAEYGAAETDWVTCLRRALHEVLRAEAVAVLPGWEASRGAVLEVHVAKALDMVVRPAADWLTFQQRTVRTQSAT